MRRAELPILCGGSGLYFTALIEGLADIPDPGPDARAEARTLLSEIGPAALHARLAAVDPETARRLAPADAQRIARAWEVWRGTGRGLASWVAAGARPAPWRFRAILLDPPRPDLRAAIARRFSAMLANGALAEVETLLALDLDPRLPAMRAHGVPELSAYLQGRIGLDEATRRAVLVTGQYAKRQATWFRHHRLGRSVRIINAQISELGQFSEQFMADLLSFVRAAG